MRPVPALLPATELAVPEWAEQRLSNGLTVIAVHRPSVPVMEFRLWLPMGDGRAAEPADIGQLAVASTLAQTLLSGTATRTNLEIAAQVQALGGVLGAGAGVDRLMVSGNALVTGLDPLLEILAEVLSGAVYPEPEVITERERLADRIQVARSQPSHLARRALLRRIYEGHPYAVQTPEPAEVRAVDTELLRQLHDRRVRPDDAALVLVGAIEPAAALAAAERALGSWRAGGGVPALPPIPQLRPGPLLLADRPDSVQSSLRLALPAVGRTHPDHAALHLANLIFGGYFSSRWVENIREDKGFSYGPHSTVEHSLAGSVLVVAAEVATEVTAPALLETWYELGRLATVAPEPAELEQARQYALGATQLAIATQAGLAGLLGNYAGAGLRPDHLARHVKALSSVTVSEVSEAAGRYLAPAQAVTVVLGDATEVESGLATLTPVAREPA